MHGMKSGLKSPFQIRFPPFNLGATSNLGLQGPHFQLLIIIVSTNFEPPFLTQLLPIIGISPF